MLIPWPSFPEAVEEVIEAESPPPTRMPAARFAEAVDDLIEAEAPLTKMPAPPFPMPFWELVEEVIEAEAPVMKMPWPPFPDTNRFEITIPSELLAQTPWSR